MSIKVNYYIMNNILVTKLCLINLEKLYSEESSELAKSVYFLTWMNIIGILKISTSSLSAETLVLKNSLPAKFEFEDLKNQYSQNFSSGNDNSNFFFNEKTLLLSYGVGQKLFTKLSTFSIERDLTNKIDGEIILQKLHYQTAEN
ncbi:zinc finger MYM-type protein 1-like [Aphis craccivora]|uniref:Zinc finger MYM-type protein 1-like n=1 Tax=Aphis craccivora TaxID=307492 RepID=A0A6G0XDU7_APHCR|nr:zinc finger MYM-type protein 1-like [Aphis craccivora]